MIGLFLVKDPGLVVGAEIEVAVRLPGGEELGVAPGFVLTVVELPRGAGGKPRAYLVAELRRQVGEEAE